jgi:uncharacterized membrane protein (Fun14 family)
VLAVALGGALAAAALAGGDGGGTAHAAASAPGDGEDPPDKSLSGLLPEGIDVQTLSLAAGVGVVPGFCAGFALRKVGNLATFMVGGVFFMFQMAAYQGYVTIHWDAVEKDLNGLLDFNNRDDGRADGTDVTTMSEEKVHEIVGMLTHNTKGALGGFAGGFFMGWRSG